MPIDFEKEPQRGARVAAPEAVGTESDIGVPDPRPAQVGYGAHVIACRDHRGPGLGQLALDPRWAWRGAQAPSARGGERLAAQFGKTRDRIDLRGQIPIAFEQ